MGKRQLRKRGKQYTKQYKNRIHKIENKKYKTTNEQKEYKNKSNN
jgi:hypothetical protein